MKMPSHRSTAAVDESDVPDVDIKPQIDAIMKVIQKTNRDRRALKKKLQQQTEAVMLTKDEYEMKLILQGEEMIESMRAVNQCIEKKVQENAALQDHIQTHRLASVQWKALFENQQQERQREQHAMQHLICQICMDKTKSMFTRCGHGYCTGCVDRWFAYSTTCPECRKSVDRNDVRRIYLEPHVQIEAPVGDRTDNARSSSSQDNREVGRRAPSNSFFRSNSVETEVIEINSNDKDEL